MLKENKSRASRPGRGGNMHRKIYRKGQGDHPSHGQTPKKILDADQAIPELTFGKNTNFHAK